jgi:DeoR/GlpR family transcriptional regulator of sugar metabolism
MTKSERQHFIIEKVVQEKKTNSFELAKILKTSIDTVRRDLNELNDKGLISKVYGAVFPLEQKSNNVFDIVILNENKKNIIGLKALSLIQDGQVIIMSGGTTNLAFSKLIPSNLKATIYTYSLPIAMQLSQHPNIDLIFIGGKMQKNAMVTIGIDVVESLSKINADICFMGVSSININSGLTETGYEVSLIKKSMIKASDKVIAMVTSEKINTKMPHLVCEIEQLHTVITDLETTDYRLQEFRKAKINLL